MPTVLATVANHSGFLNKLADNSNNNNIYLPNIAKQ